ncbi:SDR family NAD(P)-dependent oxidoreductase [Vibrio sp. B1Z05]|uniref:SDR family NAD(P)-dependent oxidoreductase n=1 Tax=Vibrio sp. B1Z05 TaxID=2654980 RepID=UPI00128C3426|nr:SDR family NAD(P)-dependent oxidoreductase [Vibrio sp. B1Z05]MPW35476.1 SDR family NAD(P)-dependent oxidoreductase [Vibrio sp. B1Z05]
MSALLITGATSGIGEQLAYDYAQSHAQSHALENAQPKRVIYVCGQNQAKLNALAALGQHVIPLNFDITDLTACKEALHSLDPIPSTWILNAGSCEYIDDGVMDAALVTRVMQINVVGLANTIEAAQHHFTAGHHLVVMGSIASELALPRAEAYGASKAAVSYLARTLALDLSKKGILVSTVFPGFVKTPLTDKNDFPMPMMISAEQASKAIQKGIADKKAHIYFPKRFTWILRLLGSLPYSIQQRLSSKLIKGNAE